MSNPDDVPQQPGALPPRAGSVPPAGSGPQPVQQVPEGYDAPLQGGRASAQGNPSTRRAGQPGHPEIPEGYQPPPGYGVPPQGYEAPAQQPSQAQGPGGPGGSGWPAPGGRMRFELPGDRPRNVNEVLPRGGFSGMFTATGMPTELKVSYWIWLIGGLLGLLGGVIGLFGSLVMLAVLPALGIVVLLLVLAALALAAAQIILAVKMKEGREWARFALTVMAGISLVLAIVNTGVADGRGGGSWPGFLISLTAAVLMWLPGSQAWFAGLRGRTP